MITLDISKTPFAKKVDSLSKKLKSINEQISKKQGEGNDFLGWVDWPVNYDKAEVKKMQTIVNAWNKAKVDTLVVIGIGGSFLGAKAAADFVKGVYGKKEKELIFVGINLSPDYLLSVAEHLKGKKWAICVISKSGTTIEPAIAFRYFRDLLFAERKYTSKDFIVAVTDKSKGVLKEMAKEKDWATFVVPDDIGGRFSVLTPVGLFVLAWYGLKVEELLRGAAQAMSDLSVVQGKRNTNTAATYAAVRYLLNQKAKKQVEAFVSYEANMSFFSEWLKQLFGESEGKDGKGLLPFSMDFTRDLHSLGQFIQEGSKLVFETVIWVAKPNKDITIKKDPADLDKLNFLQDKKLSWINLQARNGVIDAHVSGGVPNILITIPDFSEKTLGYTFYWFMKACAYSAYLLEVNPFNQPGVEVYKANMFKLLGK